MAIAKPHPSTGEKPKAKGGSRPLDHSGCGKPAGNVDNTRGMKSTAPSGGKAHKSSGGSERKGFYPSAPSDLPSLGGKPTKIRGTW